MVQDFLLYSHPIFERICYNSSIILQDFSAISDLQTKEISLENYHKKRFYWLSVILLKGDQFLLNFMVHYNALKLYSFASNAYNRSIEEMSDSKVEQFIKEYSNLMAGYIQKLFDSNSVHLEIGIPWVTLGFDRYFQEKIQSPLTAIYSWKIIYKNEVMLTCSLEIEANNKNLPEWNWNNITNQEKDDSHVGEFEQF